MIPIATQPDEVAALEAENLRLQHALRNANLEVNSVSGQVFALERDRRSLQDETDALEKKNASLQRLADAFDAQTEVFHLLRDVHDDEQHEGPQRLCDKPACRAFVLMSEA